MIKYELKEELNAKTLTYSVLGKSTIISNTIQAFLLKKLKNNPMVRVCLHSSEEELTQYMIIAIRKDANIKFHKNLYKDKIYHLIKGKMKIMLKTENIELNVGDMFKLNKNQFAKMESLSDESIYHEVISGPFEKKDTIYE